MTGSLRIIFIALLLGTFVFAEETTGKPLSAEKAAETMVLPLGFRATLFAGEPDIVQPISFCIDDRGRLWVCEANNYPKHGAGTGDRIIILEDTDNDGRHDKKTVFYEGLNYVSGIEVGFGGAWVMSPPYFYFIPDKDGDDVPDSEPELILDGFGNHANAHNMANGFAWGPDGWLYATHGRTNWSMVGKPGAPENKRIRFDGGVWRFHPVTKKWEPFCDGTTNPWGIDWNEYGEAFITNCVNPHLFHAIQGAHYEPWRGRKSSQYAYRRIETIADHVHYVSGQDVRDNLGTDEVLNLGGGHAHCGSMIYQGGSFPDRFTGSIFLNNIHGKRVNNDILSRKGSGYTASHGPDFVISKDPWFMGVTLLYGPDGSVFVSDWSDTGECHSVRSTQKETGRIFKISYLKSQNPGYDLKAMSNAELVTLLDHKNQWWVRHARRNLQERFASGKELKIDLSPHESGGLLERLWTLHSIGCLNDDDLYSLLEHDSEYIRNWAIRLLVEDGEISEAQLAQIESMALTDTSPLVRLHITSAMQRIPHHQRWNTLQLLSGKSEDADDQNLPMMIWYALEPLVDTDPERFSKFSHHAKIPMIRQHVARRIADHPVYKNQLSLLTSNLPDEEETRIDILTGILDGLKGTSQLDPCDNWDKTFQTLIASQSRPVRELTSRLALIFGDPKARIYLKKQIADSKVSSAERSSGLQALIDSRGSETANYLLSLLKDDGISRTAIRGLAKFDFPPEKLIGIYQNVSPPARQDILQTLAARKQSGKALLDAIETGAIPKQDLSAFTARQISSLDQTLADRIEKLWGALRAPNKEKRQKITRYLKQLKPEKIASADAPAGRGHFQKLCSNCHQMFGEGGKIGPELTGSQRSNLEYLLENLIDPGASVSKDYQLNFVETIDGQTISGFIASSSEEELTIQSINEQVVVAKTNIKSHTKSAHSIMPEGLLQLLNDKEIEELFAYLSSPHQVALPKL